jgi:hypothetical protein
MDKEEFLKSLTPVDTDLSEIGATAGSRFSMDNIGQWLTDVFTSTERNTEFSELPSLGTELISQFMGTAALPPNVSQAYFNKPISGDRLEDMKIIANNLMNPDINSKIDILKKAGGEIHMDRFNNPIVRFPETGYEAYVNKPGTELDDLTEFTTQAAGYYIPTAFALNRMKEGVSFFKRAAALAGAGATTSIIFQDGTSAVLGGEQGIVADKLALNMAAGPVIDRVFAFGGKAFDLIGKLSPFPKNKTYSKWINNSDDMISKEGIEAISKAGLSNKGQNTQRVYVEMLEAGKSFDEAKLYALGEEYGIPLLRANVEGDKAQMTKFNNAIKGVYGVEAQNWAQKVNEFFEQRMLDLVSKSFGTRFTADDIKNMSPQERKEILGTFIESNVIKAATADKLYANGIYSILNDIKYINTKSLTQFGHNLDNRLEQAIPYKIGDKNFIQYYPNTAHAREVLSKLFKGLADYHKKGQKNTEPIPFSYMENARKELNNLISATKNPTDLGALRVLYKEFDRFYGDMLKGAINIVGKGGEKYKNLDKIVANARENYSKNQVLYSQKDQRGLISSKEADFEGKIIQDIINQNPNMTADKIATMLIGNAKTFTKGADSSIKIINKVKDILSRTRSADDIASVQQFERQLQEAVHFDIMGGSLGKSPIQESVVVLDPAKFKLQIDKWLTPDSQGRKLFDQIFGPKADEIAVALREFHKILAQYKPPRETINNSNTAANILVSVMDKVPAVKQLLTFAAFKFGNLEGYYGLKAFENVAKTRAPDVIKQISAKSVTPTRTLEKLLNEDFSAVSRWGKDIKLSPIPELVDPSVGAITSAIGRTSLVNKLQGIKEDPGMFSAFISDRESKPNQSYVDFTNSLIPLEKED